MSNSKSFICHKQRQEELISLVQRWLAEDNFECTRWPSSDGAQLLKFEKRGRWRKFIGMSTALTVAFRSAGDNINIEIGAARVLDKLIIAAIGLFVFLWPLTLTASYGAWEQFKLPQRILNQISLFIRNG